MPITVGSPLLRVGTALVGPDTTGNARGANAIDIQTSRSGAHQVASGEYDITIGASAVADSGSGVAIGSTAAAQYGSGNVAVGCAAVASGYPYGSAVALGYGARTNGSLCISIGGGAKAYSAAMTDPAIAIGGSAYAKMAGSIAIGWYAKGYGTTYGSAIAIGRNAAAMVDHDIAIGRQAYCHGGSYGRAIAIGYAAQVYVADYGIAIGRGANTFGVSGMALGHNARASTTQSLAVGYGAREYYGGAAIGPGISNYYSSYKFRAGFKTGGNTFDFGLLSDGKLSIMGLAFRSSPNAGAKTCTHSIPITCGGNTFHVLLSS